MSVKEIFKSEKIEYFAPIPYSLCTLTRPYLLERDGIEAKSVICFAVPYFTGYGENISAYAVSRDYHAYMNDLFDRLTLRLSEAFCGAKFVGYADKSPIDERAACALAGLGVIGKNGLLITEKYSSFVFLGEIISDVSPEILGYTGVTKIKYCEGCGKCTRACPMNTEGCECLSSLTQKKGTLTEGEAELLVKYNTAWGCDICQSVCPHTKRAIDSESALTPIDWFWQMRTPRLTYSQIKDMSDEEFALRAYSWRKRETVLRNLSLFEDKF